VKLSESVEELFACLGVASELTHNQNFNKF